MRTAKVFQGTAHVTAQRNLVAAARKCHFQGSVSRALLVTHRAANAGNAHGNRHGEGVVTDFDVHDAGQNVKAVGNAFLQHLLGENGKVFISVIFADHTAQSLDPIGNDLLNAGSGFAVAGAYELGQLLQIVQRNICHNGIFAVCFFLELQYAVDVAEHGKEVFLAVYAHGIALQLVSLAVAKARHGAVGQQIGVVCTRLRTVSGNGDDVDGDRAEFRKTDIAYRGAIPKHVLQRAVDDFDHTVTTDDRVGHVDDVAEHVVNLGVDLICGGNRLAQTQITGEIDNEEDGASHGKDT